MSTERDAPDRNPREPDRPPPGSAPGLAEDERLEAEAKGRRTATDVKTAGERLKDHYRG